MIVAKFVKFGPVVSEKNFVKVNDDDDRPWTTFDEKKRPCGLILTIIIIIVIKIIIILNLKRVTQSFIPLIFPEALMECNEI